MNSFQCLLVVMGIGISAAGAAYSQTPSPVAKPQASSTSAPTTGKDKVGSWTTRQWQAAQKVWAKDEVHWAACRKQSTDQKLTGRHSWTFLYTCMTSGA